MSAYLEKIGCCADEMVLRIPLEDQSRVDVRKIREGHYLWARSAANGVVVDGPHTGSLQKAQEYADSVYIGADCSLL